MSKEQLLKKMIQINNSRNKSSFNKLIGANMSVDATGDAAKNIPIDTDDLLSTDEEIED